MQAILLLIGTMIGAGFASGKEITLFFLSSHPYTYGALAIASILLGIILYKSIRLVQEQPITHYAEWIQAISPPKMASLYNSIINLFLLITFYIMVAGFGSYFSQETHLPLFFGILLIIGITYIACRGNIQAITHISNLVIPFLILGIIHIWLKNVDNPIAKIPFPTQIDTTIGMAILKAILYTSYNSIILLPMTIAIAKNITTKRKALYISITTASIVGILGCFLCQLLSQATPAILQQTDLPLLMLLSQLQPSFRIPYGILIAVAILTSAIAALYGYLQNITRTPQQYHKWLCIFCITAIPISQIGFSNLLQSLYPTFGIIGIVQILWLLRKKRK